MNLLDRYIIKKFFSIIIYVILAFIVIFIIVDLIENLDKFLSHDAKLAQVTLYYFYYVPYIITLTLPVSMLLSSLFSLGSMAQYNELIAIKSSGVSLYRILLPVFALALFISLLSGIFGETLLPAANRARLDIYRYDIKKEVRTMKISRHQLAIQDGNDRQIYIQYYETNRKKAHKVNIIWARENKIYKRLDARFMVWNDLKSRWRLESVTERIIGDSSEKISKFDTLTYASSLITPDELQELKIQPEEMNYNELSRFVSKMLSLGADARKWLVDLYMKISYPFANFIIVLFGAPLAARKRRSGPALGFALALLISFVYFLFMRSGQVLGHKGNLDPWLAAWVGNMVFGVGALIILARVKK